MLLWATDGTNPPRMRMARSVLKTMFNFEVTTDGVEETKEEDEIDITCLDDLLGEEDYADVFVLDEDDEDDEFYNNPPNNEEIKIVNFDDNCPSIPRPELQQECEYPYAPPVFEEPANFKNCRSERRWGKRRRG